MSGCRTGPPRPDHPVVAAGLLGRIRTLHRINALREVPARTRFLSCEPLLEGLGELDLDGIHWVIVGGESGAKARPMSSAWAEDVRDEVSLRPRAYCESLLITPTFAQTSHYGLFARCGAQALT